jgi:acyl-CoA dehydrogenase
MWTFETDPEYQPRLDWAAEFMRTRVEPPHAENLARHGR